MSDLLTREATSTTGLRDQGGVALANAHPRASGGWAGSGHFLLEVGRQLGGVLFVFFLATLITFLLGAASNLGPAATLLGDSASPDAVAHLNHQFGLDKPLYVQYFDWLGGIFHGDLGRSWFQNEAVATMIIQRLPISLSVALLALIIGILVGTLLGIVAAVRAGSLLDRAITVFTSGISALPPFVFSILLILVIAVWLRLLPSAGYVPLTEGFGPWFSHVILPGIALSLEVIADIARQLRAGLIGVFRENYITAAVVRGYSKSRVLFVHALRNGAGPALTVLGLRAPGVLGGAVITESIFNMVGYARLTTEAALGGDVPVVQGTLVVGIVMVLAFNLVINVVLLRLQPAGRRRA